MYGANSSLYSYRVYDHGEVALEGCVEKPGRSYCDVKDILASARLQGLDTGNLDAIGLALPGVVDGSRVHMIAVEMKTVDFARLSERLGVPIFVDNNANAAAAGCYVSQDRYESIMLQRQPTVTSLAGRAPSWTGGSCAVRTALPESWDTSSACSASSTDCVAGRGQARACDQSWRQSS